MTIHLFLLLVFMASVATVFVIALGARGSAFGVDVNRRMGIVISAVVLALWGVIAINSFEVTVYSGGQEFTREYAEMAYLAVLGGGIAMISMFQAAIEEIRATGGI